MDNSPFVKRMAWRTARLAWIAIQLALVMLFMERGAFFFYQGF